MDNPNGSVLDAAVPLGKTRLAVAALVLAAGGASAAGLLTGRLPSSVGGGAPMSPAFTDGQVHFDGAPWDAPGAVRIPAGGYLQWDIGRVEPIFGFAIQADNNDDYVVSVSELGLAWLEVWRSGTVATPGVQTREVKGLATRARYIRVTPVGGDGNYSVVEFEAFANDAQRARSKLLRPKWLPEHPLDVAWTWAVAIAALTLLLVGQRSSPAAVVTAGAVLVGGALAMFKLTVFDPPSADAARLNFMRAAVALLAAVAVGRSLVFRKRHPAHEGLAVVTLGATAVFGVLCFLNLGRPQFHDVGARRPTYLHHYDMRTYFPIAKYFPELRFDGVYAASAAVVAEDGGGLDAMGHVGFRDLRTHVPTNAKDARAHVEEVRARFSPERWEAFKKDMAYFRRAMGDGGFLGSMADHGGNATPVWFTSARLLFGFLPASDFALWVGVVVDALLLLLGFAALGWAFGPRTALLAATVFGAMDFYMFGTNWFGAALRHDWLALWCLGLAALKKERFRLAGALLAWSALIRAFPALTFVTLAVPPAWDAARALLQRRFVLAEWAKANRGVLQVALGAAVFGGALFAVSALLFGPSSWVDWWRKVSMLNADGHLNNLAVKTYVVTGGWGYKAVVGMSLLAVAVAVRRAPWVEAAAFGVVLLPVVFNPANYYLHAVFLLVVLGREVREAPLSTPVGGRLDWLTLLLMCVSSWLFASLTPNLGVHFRNDTYVLLTALAVVWAVQVVRSFQKDAPLSSASVERPPGEQPPPVAVMSDAPSAP